MHWSDLSTESPEGNILYNLPIGVADDVRFVVGEVKLEPGDKLILYTDGLPEAMNSSGQQIGPALWESLAADGDDPESIVRAAFDCVEGHVGQDTSPNDDMTMIAFEVLEYTKGNKFSLFFNNNIRPRLGEWSKFMTNSEKVRA